MLVEGLYLHNQIAVSVFSKKPNYTIFYAMGWGECILLYFCSREACRPVDTIYQYIVCVYARIERKHMLNIGKYIDNSIHVDADRGALSSQPDSGISVKKPNYTLFYAMGWGECILLHFCSQKARS